jgi:hypothetical protein
MDKKINAAQQSSGAYAPKPASTVNPPHIPKIIQTKRYRPKFKFWLGLVALFAVCRLIADFAAPYLGVNAKIAFLITLATAYLVLSAIAEITRYRLRRRITTLSAEDRAAYAQDYPEAASVLSRTNPWSARVTIWTGAILINCMVLPIMLAPLALLQVVFQIKNAPASALCLALGFCAAWIYWSITVTVWRWWATARRGLSAEEVQWRGQQALLLWPKGHFFEKTELGYLWSRFKRK